MGVDYGRKRVGLALADPLRMFAQPYGTFSPNDAFHAIEGLHASEGIETVVVGWPLTLDGEEGPATAMVQEFVNRLRNAFGDAFAIVKRDERFTSEMAKDAIRLYGQKRKGPPDRGRIDAAAAALILQDYLDMET